MRDLRIDNDVLIEFIQKFEITAKDDMRTSQNLAELLAISRILNPRIYDWLETGYTEYGICAHFGFGFMAALKLVSLQFNKDFENEIRIKIKTKVN